MVGRRGCARFSCFERCSPIPAQCHYPEEILSSTFVRHPIMLPPMSRYLALLTLFLASCASTKQLQVRSVTLPSSASPCEVSDSQVLEAARKGGGTVRTWAVPLRVDGTFALADQKRAYFVTDYDPPTSIHSRPKPLAYSSRMVGVSIAGRVDMTSPTKREVSLSFTDTKKAGVNRFGPGVEQPVFQSSSLDTSFTINSLEWAVVVQPPTPNATESHYLLVRAP